MKKYADVLKGSKLFANVSEDEILAMLACLDAKERHYKEGEYVFRQGETVDSVSVLAEGALLVQADDYWGNRSIITSVSPGELFGQAYLAGEAIMNDVAAAKDSTVVFFDAKRVLTTCSSACPFHNQVIRNLFFALSETNLRLVTKLGHIQKRTTREKLMSYLSLMAKKAGSNSFTIPFNRQELADFLSVDRSAMSAELCRMRDEGLLRFNKSSFTLM
ncbi:MAG: Crp/Fnr family transcriptional regulator [Clostridia bacterium]|nr:Crp/Fnr family transcriptional regulator [Clostridia bacterium]